MRCAACVPLWGSEFLVTRGIQVQTEWPFLKDFQSSPVWKLELCYLAGMLQGWECVNLWFWEKASRSCSLSPNCQEWEQFGVTTSAFRPNPTGPRAKAKPASADSPHHQHGGQGRGNCILSRYWWGVGEGPCSTCYAHDLIRSSYLPWKMILCPCFLTWGNSGTERLNYSSWFRDGKWWSSRFNSGLLGSQTQPPAPSAFWFPAVGIHCASGASFSCTWQN